MIYPIDVRTIDSDDVMNTSNTRFCLPMMNF
jgi:hypothetical protein